MSHKEINDVERHACGQNQQTMWKMFENARRRQMATLEELIEWVWGSTFQGPANWNDLPREIATEFVAIAAAMILLAGCAITIPLRDAPSGHMLTDPSNVNMTCTPPSIPNVVVRLR
jgi:hypothetical protein